MCSAEGTVRGRTARVVVGVLLFLAGIVLWLALDAPWCGIISGVGVVVLYPVVGERIERWRAEQGTGD